MDRAGGIAMKNFIPMNQSIPMMNLRKTANIFSIKRFSKYTEVVHLWNVKVSDNLENNHFPALPSLNVEDGWAPIDHYLKILKEANKNVKIMFEHRSDLISDEELQDCYSWIQSLLK